MFDIESNLKNLPDKPGVYLHKDIMGEIIYVGKAVSLKNRVRQYFHNSAKLDVKTRSMVAHIYEFEYITCKTEMEALILECNLIKRYRPKYNVLLRDDKTYPYIVVTVSEEFPRILKTRRIKKDGNKYFGPYSDVGAVNTIVDLLNDILPLKKCTLQKFPQGHRECLNYHIGKCLGVCINTADKEAYAQHVESALNYLSGRDKSLERYLTNKMNICVDTLNFEEASKYRDFLNSLKSLQSLQRVSYVSGKDLDVVLHLVDEEQSSVVLFSYRDGKFAGREIFPLNAEHIENDEQIISSFIKQYYSMWALPVPEIIVETEIDDASSVEEFLRKGEYNTKIICPQKGEKKQILMLVKDDASELLKTMKDRSDQLKNKKDSINKEIAEIISASGFTPRNLTTSYNSEDGYRIESYDISNTNGIDTVGAMIVFEGLRKVKKDYRRFKIKTIVGQNDYGSLEEMIRRRYKRALGEDSSFSKIPDAIFVDGGMGQVSSVSKVLIELNLQIPIVGMVKDDAHRTKNLILPSGEEIEIKQNPLLYGYIGSIQEEVHRFAIDFHTKTRNKNMIKSSLDNIEGVGEKRRNALLKHFTSIDKIKGATEEELLRVPSITHNVAKAIVDHFKS